MNFIETAKKRYSVRSYADKKVEAADPDRHATQRIAMTELVSYK